MTSLCAGYKHVQAFGPDDDYQDEQVLYVTLDLANIEPTLVPSSSTYRLIGLDTPTPFLQLSGTILKGTHESLLGTELIFTDAKDPHDPSKKSIVHTTTTSQRICFREVRLLPKGTLTTPPTKDTPDAWVAEADAAAHMVDRVTGKNVSRPRATRRSAVPQRARTTRASRAKGKGKAKAKDDDQEPMQVDLDDDDDI